MENIEEATRFYQQLFDLNGKRVSSGRHYFNLGGIILACYDSRADGDTVEFHPNPDHIYIAVDNLDELLTCASKLPFIKLDKKIEIRPWGERSFYAEDPFGNPLCFVDSKTIFTGN
ncbi:MAG: VOC family protein [Parcubacteria group bacterium]|nr:VOC family protein [Parcubacteria group bacterium]